MSFLKAEWRKLAIVNYVIEPEILSKFIPFGTELDLWQDKCYISVVGFMFLNTKLLGIKVPFHVNFEEVNLRFYVKRLDEDGWKRGVVFIKELVPRRALSFVANLLYHENYQTLPMQHNWDINRNHITVEYQWNMEGESQRINVVAEKKPLEIKPNSEAEFITEHYWGYAKVEDKITNEYEVTHPRWQTYKVLNFEVEIDFGRVYGIEFEFLNELKPVSVMLAEGSEITVEKRRILK